MSLLLCFQLTLTFTSCSQISPVRAHCCNEEVAETLTLLLLMEFLFLMLDPILLVSDHFNSTAK